jgi:hypothetical protein
VSLVLIVVLVILVFAVAYGLFTVRGSGISENRYAGRHAPPGAEGPSEASGTDQGEGSATSPDFKTGRDPQHGARRAAALSVARDPSA